MARKAGQLISRGLRIWLVRISLGRDPETGNRKYHTKPFGDHSAKRKHTSAGSYKNAKSGVSPVRRR
jgi:hypothetical protein